MLSSSNAVNGLSVDELLILFGAKSSSSSRSAPSSPPSRSISPETSPYVRNSGAPSGAVTYSISPAGISRLVVNHSLDQNEAAQEATFNASVSLDAINALDHGSASGVQSWNDATLAATSDGADDAQMNVAGVELYL